MLITTILKRKIAPNNRLRSAFRVTFGVRNSISSDRQGQSPGGTSQEEKMSHTG